MIMVLMIGTQRKYLETTIKDSIVLRIEIGKIDLKNSFSVWDLAWLLLVALDYVQVLG